jgi:predicted ATP-grasp superfamily ATP-dependent carboligase
MSRLLKNNTGVIIIEGHIQGLSNTRALGEAGIPVIVIDRNNCVARYSKYCTRFFLCPDYQSDEFIDFLIDMGHKHSLYGWSLIPSNDHIVLTISRNKERLGNIFKIITPDITIIEKIYNKELLLKTALSCGVDIPVSYFSLQEAQADKNLTYPFLIKGRAGLTFYKSVGKKVFVINNSKELNDVIEFLFNKGQSRNFFIQSIIKSNNKNKTISVAVFAIEGVIMAYWMGEKLREHPLRFGTGTFCRSIYNTELIEPSRRIVKALNYTGVCEIEFLFDPFDNKYKLIEINARTWLWVELAKACGVNFTLIIYNYLNNLPVNYPKDYKQEIYWINYITDTVYSIIGILKGTLTLKEYLKTFIKKKIRAVFSWKDFMPGIIFPFLLLFITKKRRR